MRTSIKSVIILLIVIQFAIYANAGNSLPLYDSNNKMHNPTIAFSLLPLYTIQSGFSVNLDIHLRKNNWLIIGPQYFIAENKPLNLFLGVD